MGNYTHFPEGMNALQRLKLMNHLRYVRSDVIQGLAPPRDLVGPCSMGDYAHLPEDMNAVQRLKLMNHLRYVKGDVKYADRVYWVSWGSQS